MKTKLVAVCLVAIIVVAGAAIVFTWNSDDVKGNESSDTVKDMAGRSVEIPDNLDRGIVTFGSVDPLRFVSYFNLNEKVIEVDDGDVTDNKNGRAYSYAYDYDKLTKVHSDNAITSEDVERVANLQPSLVIVGGNVYANYADMVNILAKAVPVFVLKSMSTSAAYWDPATYKLNDDFTQQITQLGIVLKETDRAKELISGFNKYLQELKSMIGTTDEKIITSGLTISGSNPLNVTFPFYAPLEVNGVSNVYNQSKDTKVELDVETVAKLNMTMMLIDPSSSDKIIGNNSSQLVMDYIYGVNNDADPSNDISMYTVLPIMWDGCNWDVSLVGSFYISYLLYDSMSQKDVMNKMNEIFEFFYGSDGSSVISDMSQFFNEKSSKNGVELPLFSQVEIVKNAGGYTFSVA